MKKVLVTLLVTAIVLGMAIPVMADTPLTKQLISDGRDTREDVGDLTVTSDGTNLVVTFDTNASDWEMTETHLYVSTSTPIKSAPGKFPFKNEVLSDPNYDTYTIAYSDIPASPGDMVSIAAHAELEKDVTVDSIIITLEESAWAQESDYENPLDTFIRLKKNWATYFEYTLAASP